MRYICQNTFIMKFLLLLTALCLCINLNAQSPKYVFDNVEIHTNVPGMGEGKLKRFSATISKYITSIEKGDLTAWKSLLSDSTIARVAPHKFTRKLDKLKKYQMSADTIKVVEAKLLGKPFKNEVGSEYQVILEFPKAMNIAERVTFDYVKRSKDVANAHLFAINIVVVGKESFVVIHKYINATNGENQGNQ